MCSWLSRRSREMFWGGACGLELDGIDPNGIVFRSMPWSPTIMTMSRHCCCKGCRLARKLEREEERKSLKWATCNCSETRSLWTGAPRNLSSKRASYGLLARMVARQEICRDNRDRLFPEATAPFGCACQMDALSQATLLCWWGYNPSCARDPARPRATASTSPAADR